MRLSSLSRAGGCGTHSARQPLANVLRDTRLDMERAAGSSAAHRAGQDDAWPGSLHTPQAAHLLGHSGGHGDWQLGGLEEGERAMQERPGAYSRSQHGRGHGPWDVPAFTCTRAHDTRVGRCLGRKPALSCPGSVAPENPSHLPARLLLSQRPL